MSAAFSLLGAILGLVAGLQWGIARGWLVTMGTTAGGAVVGGLGGWLFGWLLESSSEFVRRVSDRLSARRRVLGEAFRWSSLVLMIALLLLCGYLFVRALPRYYR